VQNLKFFKVFFYIPVEFCVFWVCQLSHLSSKNSPVVSTLLIDLAPLELVISEPKSLSFAIRCLCLDPYSCAEPNRLLLVIRSSYMEFVV